MKRKAAGAIAGIALGLVAVTSAFAAEPPLTTISIDIMPVSATKAQYKGELVSEVASCEKRRVVKVSSEGDRLVRTVSNSKGKFKEVGKLPPEGKPITLKVKAKSKDCPALSETQSG